MKTSHKLTDTSLSYTGSIKGIDHRKKYQLQQIVEGDDNTPRVEKLSLQHVGELRSHHEC
jgi:hypothetical protein